MQRQSRQKNIVPAATGTEKQKIEFRKILFDNRKQFIHRFTFRSLRICVGVAQGNQCGNLAGIKIDAENFCNSFFIIDAENYGTYILCIGCKTQCLGGDARIK